jgi:endoglucanase
MDEVGMMITHVDEAGLALFEPVGGIRDGLYPGTRVLVGRDAIPGVIGLPPVHLQGAASKEEPVKREQLRIDLGDIGEGAVQVGDYVTFDTQFHDLGETLMGKAFDDRIGCMCLIEALKAKTGASLVCAFTVQEEVGLRGARVAPAHVNADVAIACEGTFALDVPGMKAHERMPCMGKGPALTLADKTLISDRGVLSRIVSAARAHDIPYQYKRPFLGGTDAGAFHIGGSGTPSAVIAAPCRYIHSPCALARTSDIASMTRLVVSSIETIKEEGI